MNKVLIALDFDPTAQKVADAGYALAKKLGSGIVLLHVVSNPLHYSSLKHVTVMGFAGYNDTDPLILKDLDVLKKESLKFLDKSKKHLGDASIETMVKSGKLADSILKTAKEVHADIIVMGSHSHRMMEDILLGSVTEKVLSKTILPVFLVPTKKTR